jgi:serine/threonine-protein kinase
MYTRIGPYQPLKKIATGGMADVLLANRTGTPNELFALKVLLEEYEIGSTVYKNFVDEAGILVDIDDQHIVKTYSYGNDYKRPYFVMEYIHGVSGSELMLEARRAKKMVPLGLSLGIIRTIAIALDQSYNALSNDGVPRKIIHNDVSPHNFQVGFDGNVKLLDYGVAIHQTENSVNSRRGKFAYMSPEAIQKSPLDHRSDLFSLGVSFYEMVVHRRAFKSKTPKETMARVLSGDLKRPSQLSPSFPAELEMIIMKSLAPAAADRYQTGRALADAITAFATSMNLDLSEHTQATRLKKLLGSVINERNEELAQLQVSTSVLPKSEQTMHAPHKADYEIVYMELPTIPLRFAALTAALALTAVLMGAYSLL